MNEELQRIGVGFDLESTLRLFGLVMARFVGASMAIPFFGGSLIPGRIKTGIPAFLALFAYPFVAATVVPAHVPAFGIVYLGLAVKEIAVGYALGFIVSLPFNAVETAGSFMDTQRGTTFAQVVAPLMSGQTSLLGQLYLLLFLALFLSMGGIHLVVGGILESYDALPILEAPRLGGPNAPFVTELIRLTGDVFTVGLKLAAPVVIAMFMTDAVLGVVNRAAPNIQVFFLGMPLKALGGLVIVLVTIGFAANVFSEYAVRLVASLERAARLIAGGA